jgi:valyl-tRNA synthetase
MSKSLGNSPDPLDLIKKFGADGVRVGMLFCSPAGNDLLFDEALTEQGRNFSNKIWNTFRLIKGWKVDDTIPQPEVSAIAVKWFDNKLNEILEKIEAHFTTFRLSDSLMLVYNLIRDEFSGWYLEAIKPDYQKPIDRITYDKSLNFLEQVLKILHPFMPFISEEIYQLMKSRKEGDSIMISKMPQSADYDKVLLADFESAKEIVGAIRNVRQEKNIPNKETVELMISTEESTYHKGFLPLIEKLANISSVNFVTKPEGGSVTFMVGTTQYSVPLDGLIDTSGEKKKLEEELKYQEGFLHSVMKKLGNDRFVNNAPEMVVNNERQKAEDAKNRIKTLKERLAEL